MEVLLRRASMGQLIYSDHFQSFIGNTEVTASNITFAAERYTDVRGLTFIILLTFKSLYFSELRALAQLIGPYGIKFMTERLTWHIACQITELYKIIRDYREAIHTARINFDKPEKLREVCTFDFKFNIFLYKLKKNFSSKEK